MVNPYEDSHIQQLRAYLPECCVLLKSDGAFPLKEAGSIACFGGGVRNTIKGGTGSGEVNSRYFINVEEALKSAGFTITNPEWPELFAGYVKKAKEAFRQELKAKAKREKTNVILASMGSVMMEPDYDIPLDTSAEAAIYVVSRISGEGNDRHDQKGDYQLTDSEVRDIRALNEHYEHFLLVINSGGPVDLTPVLEVRNILLLSQLGVETGHALADILLGKGNPSGRLTTSWAVYKEYGGIGEFAEKDDTRYKEGIYVGYRYFDAVGQKTLFPFGYGLSYTTFEKAVSSIEEKAGAFEVTVSVKNTGAVAGKETVQLYLSCPRGALDKEVKSLAAFGKTSLLQPGESEEITLTFSLTAFASYDTANAQYILEKGDYILLLGENSEEVTPIGVGQLEKTMVVRKVKNLFGQPDFEDYIGGAAASFDVSGLPILPIYLSEDSAEEVSYDKPRGDLPDFSSLTDEEVALLNVGNFSEKGGIMSVIGSASSTIPGAAGDSTHRLEGKGIGHIVMADGPAGLRVAREYVVDDKGIHVSGGMLPESMLEMLPKLLQWLVNRKPKVRKGAQVVQQYTTAIPIGTAVAQSWNTEFARVCGDIVGTEMDVFGVDLWLAPALNIHRNVLCGRNFEYFSEDPLISGKMAAAITAGVQAHKGRGVTLKHFAANNQETNRYANNSVVSERALREIYLKGFAICIQESQPAALMTSYNLINGVHTSESRALTTNYLRDELGFDGIVMTDWVIGGDLLTKNPKYPGPKADLVAKAGCSLFMPGSKNDYTQIVEGLKSGTVSRAQLEENAGWLVRRIQAKQE